MENQPEELGSDDHAGRTVAEVIHAIRKEASRNDNAAELDDILSDPYIQVGNIFWSSIGAGFSFAIHDVDNINLTLLVLNSYLYKCYVARSVYICLLSYACFQFTAFT